MHATDILAYVYDGELFCAEHGEQYDNGEDDSAGPIFADGGSEFAGIEYCADRHSFCMSCGSDVDGDDVSGHFSQCWNCRSETVYVDGLGRDWTAGGGGWADALETHNIELYVSPTVMPRPMTDQNNYVTVTAILDESCGPIRNLRAYAVYLLHSPIDDCALILANSWEDARETGEDYFVEKSEPADETELDDVRSDVMCQEVPTDQVWFTTRR